MMLNLARKAAADELGWRCEEADGRDFAAIGRVDGCEWIYATKNSTRVAIHGVSASTARSQLWFLLRWWVRNWLGYRESFVRWVAVRQNKRLKP